MEISQPIAIRYSFRAREQYARRWKIHTASRGAEKTLGRLANTVGGSSGKEFLLQISRCASRKRFSQPCQNVEYMPPRHPLLSHELPRTRDHTYQGMLRTSFDFRSTHAESKCSSRQFPYFILHHCEITNDYIANENKTNYILVAKGPKQHNFGFLNPGILLNCFGFGDQLTCSGETTGDHERPGDHGRPRETTRS